MASVATGSVPAVDRISGPSSKQSIEEVCFTAALICIEGHQTTTMMPGPLTKKKVSSIVARTLEKTQSFQEVREAFSKNVEIWIYLTQIFDAAVGNLTSRTTTDVIGDRAVSAMETSAAILKNSALLKEDLQMLDKLMHIARNMLVTTEPQVPQDICTTVGFNQVVYQVIAVCVNITSKGYDGEILDDNSRTKLNEINGLCKFRLTPASQPSGMRRIGVLTH